MSTAATTVTGVVTAGATAGAGAVSGFELHPAIVTTRAPNAAPARKRKERMVMSLGIKEGTRRKMIELRRDGQSWAPSRETGAPHPGQLPNPPGFDIHDPEFRRSRAIGGEDDVSAVGGP